jgi:hypothetical protein
MMPIFLRTIAIAIAVAAFIDPVLTLDRPQPSPLVLVDLAASGTQAIEQRFRDDATTTETRRPAGHRLPCAPRERCVIVADGSVGAAVPEDVQQVALIKVTPDDTPNLAIQRAVVTSTQHSGAAGAARVLVSGRGVSGQKSEVRVLDGAAQVGSASIEWTADGDRWVDVPWWPIAIGARLLRLEVATAGGENTVFDNAIDIGVQVVSTRLPVLVFDARPSWSSTFVRRALEDDTRFAVEHRVRVAPSIATSTSNGRLDAAVLDRTGVLIVGAPEALTTGDVALIDRFVRVRGGTAILLPERVPSGPSASLFHGQWTEQLVAEPEVAGPLRATELLRPRGLVLGSLALTPLVIVTPAGNGRIVVSGAMDAWRHRDRGGDRDAAAFDRFWTAVAADGAALGAPLRIEFDESIGRPGSRLPFTLRYRTMHDHPTTHSPRRGGPGPPPLIEASAVARCSDRAGNIRLWPAGSVGVFRGELPVAAVSACTVEAAVNDARAVSGVAIASQPSRPAHETLAALERAARASGGPVTDEDNLGVIGALNNTTTMHARTPVYPMRSPWWMVPFAGLLSVEWWLRRRKGLH